MTISLNWRTRIIAFLIAAACVLMPLDAHAKGESNRTDKRFGFTAGLAADPFPNMVGASLRFNVTSWFQLHAGYGYLTMNMVSASGTVTSSTITTTALGGGARLFVPGWNLSPYAGFTYTSWSATGSFQFLGQNFNSSTGMPAVMYASFGLDWQTSVGFNVGGGVHYILGPTLISNAISIVPNLYVGWYF